MAAPQTYSLSNTEMGIVTLGGSALGFVTALLFKKSIGTTIAFIVAGTLVGLGVANIWNYDAQNGTNIFTQHISMPSFK